MPTICDLPREVRDEQADALARGDPNVTRFRVFFGYTRCNGRNDHPHWARFAAVSAGDWRNIAIKIVMADKVERANGAFRKKSLGALGMVRISFEDEA
jgi:hypothetical protein